MKIYKSKSIIKSGERILIFILLSSVIISLTNCSSDDGNEVQPSGMVTESISHEGINRTYHIYFPTNFSTEKSAPMVFALHGGGGTGSNFEEFTSDGTLTEESNQRGVILVFPDGIQRRWNDGRPEPFGNDTMYDDVGLISKIIDRMIEKYKVDANRIYSTGISNGGFLSIRLAMDLSDKIAAIAPVTAQVSEALALARPQFPISMMIVNGTEDPIVPYDGGDIRLSPLGASRGAVLSTAESIDRFKIFNGCSTAGVVVNLPDLVANDGTEVKTVTYTGCDESTEIVLVEVIGGGHTWPGGDQYLPTERVGVVSREINASKMIMDFFLRHSLNN